MNPHTPNLLSLDSDYDIADDSWIVIIKPSDNPSNPGIITLPAQVRQVSLAAYGITGKSTQISLASPWIGEPESFSTIRGTVVYAHSEALELAEEPLNDPICGDEQQTIELDGFYDGLASGRWVVIAGEREIAGTSGIQFSELAMLSSVTQDVQRTEYTGDETTGTEAQYTPLAGDKTHTYIKLATKLAYCFKRDTVTVYANVVKASHGETRTEVLGNGDGAKALQSFVLKQPPLTFVSASNRSGVDSTLKVFVNDIQWHESDSLVDFSRTDRGFVTKTDDDGKTTVQFGNGREGARLPTGIENVKAEYRNGIGSVGNVRAGRISLLSTRPLGVKGVVNPLPASGGADRESRDQARKNIPLAVKALDRLVSVQDYEDFARTFGGVGKARAVELSDGRRQLVHITIAGADDIPIDQNSDLYRNLRRALLDFGDPYQAIRLEIRELMLIVISAGVRILPDYQWEPVVSQVRSALLDAFSFDRRELGQDVLLSEVQSVMQSVRGVAYVDVDIFGGVPEKRLRNDKRELLTSDEIAAVVQSMGVGEDGKSKPVPNPRISVNLAQSGTVLPAQLAFLTPEVPDTLILNQIN